MKYVLIFNIHHILSISNVHKTPHDTVICRCLSIYFTVKNVEQIFFGYMPFFDDLT